MSGNGPFTPAPDNPGPHKGDRVMDEPIAWVAEPPKIAIDGDGVLFTIRSGERTRSCHMSRALFRRVVEQGRRMLDQADLAERERVVRWRGKKR